MAQQWRVQEVQEWEVKRGDEEVEGEGEWRRYQYTGYGDMLAR